MSDGEASTEITKDYGFWHGGREGMTRDRIAGRLVGWNYWNGAGAIPFFVGLGSLGRKGGMDLKDPVWTSARRCTQQGGMMALDGCRWL